MSDQRLYLMAKIQPKPSYALQVKNAILDIIAPTHCEEGVDCFRLHEVKNSTSPCFYLYEIFKNQEALDFHYAQDFITPIFEHYKTWLESPVEVTQLQHLAG
jgi:quinol monooxygenase YgiN